MDRYCFAPFIACPQENPLICTLRWYSGCHSFCTLCAPLCFSRPIEGYSQFLSADLPPSLSSQSCYCLDWKRQQNQLSTIIDGAFDFPFGDLALFVGHGRGRLVLTVLPRSDLNCFGWKNATTRAYCLDSVAHLYLGGRLDLLLAPILRHDVWSGQFDDAQAAAAAEVLSHHVVAHSLVVDGIPWACDQEPFHYYHPYPYPCQCVAFTTYIGCQTDHD